MFGLTKIFKRNDQSDNHPASADPNDQPSPQQTSVKSGMKSWFDERYEIAATQRNWVFALSLCCIVGIIISVFAVTKISLSKEFDPFVIQIDKNTGVAKVVNPLDSGALKGDDALARFFIKKYVVARETYNPMDFETRARDVVRLLSTPQIYGFYRGFITKEENDPVIKYAQSNSTFLTVKSWSKLEENRYVLRFAISETGGNHGVYHKIAIVDYTYEPMEMNPGDEDINPVGFRVTGYRVDDDQS